MTLTTRRRFLHLVGAALAASVLPVLASAQTWPNRVIRAVVPFTAGSAIDVIARVVLDPLSAQLGQQIVIDNRGGAGGTIGANLVAHAEPDGYTILIHASAHSLTPAVYPKAPYDTARDFAAVASFGSIPNVTVISPAKGIKTLQEMVAFAKKGKASFATSGLGSASHWAMERLRLSAGFDAVHVPYKGGPDAIREVVAGRVDFMSFGLASVLPFIREGRLLALAVSTSKRSGALPDVPTTLELGYPDSDFLFWNGMFVPAKTPRPVIERLYRELEKTLALPAVKEKLAPFGNEPMPLSPSEFDALIRKEIESNIAVVKAANLKFD
jgi:tripartite-type tricarboxylate transporter receptor subunit TctC